MQQQLFDKLNCLPRLSSANKRTLPCKICGGAAYFFDVVDFNKSCLPEIYPFDLSGIPVEYFRCAVCSFLFTSFFDDWTAQDFARFIYNEDYGKVDGEYAGVRPEREAAAMAQRLSGLEHLRILDYGSGSGHFARHLRAHGFEHVSAFDPFSDPVRPQGRFDLVTCLEVLEHCTAPHSALADVAALLDPMGCVLFSTGIQPPTIDELRANWWYVAPRNGHVSIYSLNSLAGLAQAVGLSLYVGAGCAFARPYPSAAARQILAHIGRPKYFFVLTAPDGEHVPPQQHSGWHAVEESGFASFRWTRAADIAWQLQAEPFQACELLITIPIQNEIQPGFANSCRLEIGGKSTPLVRDAGVLSASVSIDEPAKPLIRLIMPPLLRPSDLGTGADRRALGLAISTASALRRPQLG